MIRRHTATPGIALLTAALLTIAYLLTYLTWHTVPRQNAPGWWAYWDQSQTLRSAQAFAHLDLSATAHWYAPGYALLAAPFIAAGVERHPFLLVDLLCLLGTYACALVAAARCNVPPAIAALLFCAATLTNQLVFQQWVLPWNTTPVALLTWATLALADRRAILAGATTGLIAWFRTPDLAPAALALLCSLTTPRPRNLLRAVAGAAAALAPLAALHLAIYGPHPSPYMTHSADIGVTLHDFGWKAYVILADPGAWFLEGDGLLRRLPWLALGFAGLIPALARGGTARAIACALLAHLVLYLSYVDLLPPGLWRYNNVHYFKWTLPGYALLAYLALQDLLARPWTRRNATAAAALTLVAALACIRLSPRLAAPGEPAKMLILPGPRPTFETTYFSDLAITDAIGQQHNITDFRAIPDPNGTRILALRRAFVPPLADIPQPQTYAQTFHLTPPCWLRPTPCHQTPTTRPPAPSPPGRGPG